MRPTADVERVFALAADGLTRVEIAARVGIGQTTVSRWLRKGRDEVLGSPRRVVACPRETVPHRPYAYLLGQYLGDGSIVHTRRGVYRLFISGCADYPGIVDECRAAIAAVLPGNAVNQRERSGAIDVTCYSTHWPCLFPQHAPGLKHLRPIVLEPWQADIALGDEADAFVRGLVHSDGCRTLNRVRKADGRTYEYVRYMFSNRSDDIRALFVAACSRLDVETRPMGRYGVSVARRESVRRLDEVVGPKS